MARPTKAGLDYFELDCHMEEKVRLIQAEFGLKGFAVLVKLYQKIYGGFGYYCEWSEDTLLLFMSENGLQSDSKNLISEIIAACIRRNIFSEDLFNKFSILTSEGVQKRYMNATSRREKVELIKEYLLFDVGENKDNVYINSINVNKNSKNVCRNTQSREEKSRGKKRKEEESNNSACAYYPNDELLNQAFSDFVDMRKKIKKPMTDRAIVIAMNKLKELAAIPFSDSMDNDLAIKILEQSTMNCWQGLFPLKDNKESKSTSSSDWVDKWRNA